MNRVARWFLTGSIVFSVGTIAFAQTEEQPAPAPTQEGATPAEGAPDMAAMMAKMEAAAKPGDNHSYLTSMAGEWEGKVQSWMDPSAPPNESTCTTTITPILGGRFITNETKGSMDMGQGPMPFEGFGLSGYNNTTKKFESVWCDNMGTLMMSLTGELSEDGKTLTWNSKYTCPMTEQERWMRQVETHTSPTTMTFEIHGPDMQGQGDHLMVKIEYTKK